jgi:hypothetical protein
VTAPGALRQFGSLETNPCGARLRTYRSRRRSGIAARVAEGRFPELDSSHTVRVWVHNGSIGNADNLSLAIGHGFRKR